VKEKRSFKRFDLFSVLAVLGVMGVLLFESIFIFELYMGDSSKLEPYLPAILKSYLIQPAPESDMDAEQAAPVETKDTAPVEVEEPEPVG